MASVLSLALDPTFRIHSHKTLDTAQPCHLFQSQTEILCVCVCVRACVRACVGGWVGVWVVGVMYLLLYNVLWYSLLVVIISAFRLLSLNVDVIYTWIYTCIVLRAQFLC